ncbi:4-(cytidine 5'-diphospho)-2-C-methyl-D-erythritol kinase [Luteimonas sp. MC1750]|uniref:4-(cytidine 5'-diphospho)-2-C-methyl-D-erythritol kinase n=1 Tax=Luteimonas sp. MC1750 TaxID=2799326 RepID=UPI0018F06598|nr:4-(cytidine 5'-diphospho)-2-C-methyl-D-erythritol kinase [Luteimonas sp. MC1750]MBJ6985445.1 4-(cytidine 5'-diphospho)-2-C-methyl-D-erythritol kinase [Luteimonas sp. MC1750]QQO05302.1 4-(cytidine 5'-diphospho)-2-C-methyl-D-erythritol kinase [Luteimonas sp. MC1750]
MTAAGWSAWPAPAKLNLFLRITGRRPDGYHELQTVFRLLDWGDTVHLRPREDGRIVRHGGDLSDVPEAADLSLRAARLLQDAFNVAQGVDIRVEKRIPTGGGFGGGSSDAATVLRALDALWGLGADVDALAALGARLGADVPVFVHGHSAWAEGVGERLRPLDLAPAWYLVADPGVHVATAALFQAPELTRDAAPATMADFASGAPLGNAFEPVLRRLEPAVEAVFQVLARAGTPRLTGTGSGCFVEFAAREPAEAALATLPPGFRARVVAGVSRSPLLDALAAGSPQGRRQVAQGTGF